MFGMKIGIGGILSALLVVGAMVVVAAPPADAQTARKLKCNSCVKSKNMKPNIVLGRGGKTGNFGVRDSSGSTSVNLSGSSGNVTNSFSGNGLVKAWAIINQDGTVADCYLCNRDGAETRKIPSSTGRYEVDFTPLGTDIRGRPRVCSQQRIATGDALDNLCATNDNSTDTSSVDVRMWDVNNPANAPQDSPFTIVIF